MQGRDLGYVGPLTVLVGGTSDGRHGADKPTSSLYARSCSVQPGVCIFNHLVQVPRSGLLVNHHPAAATVP